ARPRRHLRGEDLHDHLPVERDVASEEYTRHPPAAELALDAEAVAEAALEAFLKVHLCGGLRDSTAMLSTRPARARPCRFRATSTRRIQRCEPAGVPLQ